MQDVTFDLGHIKLSGLAFGESSKPVILATHGWLDNAASFIPIAQYFKDYYLVAIDFAGHGLSAHRPIGAHYHLLDNIYDLHALVVQQGWEQLILLGHSMGGILASIYAGSFPEKIRAMIMLEAFGPLVKSANTSPRQLRDAVNSRLEVASKTQRHPGTFEKAVQARLMAGGMTQDAVELLMQRNTLVNENEVEWRTDPRLRTLSSLRLTETQAESFIQAVACPTLSILGKQGFDELKQKQEAKKHLFKYFTEFECEGGHHLHMEYPQEVATTVMQFLNSLEN